MKNKKHLQGICNNVVYSLANHPANYFPFWSHLYLPEKDFDVIFHLLIDNNYPEYLTGAQCNDLSRTLSEYRGMFLNHLEIHKISRDDIKSAYFHIINSNSSGKMMELTIEFLVETTDETTNKATMVRSFWGTEGDKIEKFENGYSV